MMSRLFFPDGTKVDFEEIDVGNPQRSIDTLTVRMAMYGVEYGGVAFKVVRSHFRVTGGKETEFLFEMEVK